jgi:hypothetical protein
LEKLGSPPTLIAEGECAFGQFDKRMVALVGMQRAEPFFARKRHGEQDALRYRRLDMHSMSAPVGADRIRHHSSMGREIVRCHGTTGLPYGRGNGAPHGSVIEGRPAVLPDLFKARGQLRLEKDIARRDCE